LRTRTAKNDIAAPQGGHLTDPQAGLKHKLDERIIASGEPMRTLAGRQAARQATDRFQTAIDGSRFQAALRHHVLAPGD
jgi:hypothetical protein